MKTLSLYTVLVALALKQATAVALPEPEFHVIQNTELGPVYSNVAPNQRRDNGDTTYYPVDKNALGTVYSNIAPGISKRSDVYTPVEPSDVTTYIEENGLSKKPEKRDGAVLEKRDWRACVACVAACGLMQQGISLLSISQQVQFCLGNCALQGACTPYFRSKYGDRYGNYFPVPGAPVPP